MTQVRRKEKQQRIGRTTCNWQKKIWVESAFNKRCGPHVRLTAPTPTPQTFVLKRSPYYPSRSISLRCHSRQLRVILLFPFTFSHHAFTSRTLFTGTYKIHIRTNGQAALLTSIPFSMKIVNIVIFHESHTRLTVNYSKRSIIRRQTLLKYDCVYALTEMLYIVTLSFTKVRTIITIFVNSHNDVCTTYVDTSIVYYCSKKC